jgi:hypothetical protein
VDSQSKAVETYTPPTLTVIGSLNADTLTREFFDTYSCPKGSN